MALLSKIDPPCIAPAGAVAQLHMALRGILLTPDSAEYDDVRALYNAAIDKRPALIARCVDVADVIAVVDFARNHSVPLAIRGGGHNAAGLSSVDHGLMMDLSLMKGIHVDPIARTVRVEPGCTWSDVDHATHVFGLATPSGIIGSTGVAGLTLGGGIGHLSRRFGLTIDNLLAADVVLADGSCLTTNADESPDLFWALRGGGGNFGVVTSFLFRLHPVKTVVGGPMLWPLAQATEIMRWYRSFITTTAPEDLNGFFAFLTVPPIPPFPDTCHLQKMCGIVWCYSGPPDRADAVFGPARTLIPPAWDGVQPMPFPVLQSAFDAMYPPGLHWFCTSDFVKALPDEAIARHVEFAHTLPSRHSGMHLYPMNGAVQRKGRYETAFSYRDVTFAEVIVGVDPDPARVEAVTIWAQDYRAALHPFAAGGAYVNWLLEEGEDRVRSAYRDNYELLATVKARYDPANLFRINQNIRPAQK
jgi:hypothetical protein